MFPAPDQIFEGAALSDGEARFMFRGREGTDPLTPFRFYSMRTIELMTQQEERDYRFTDPFNEWLDYEFDDNTWKASLNRRMIADLTQFAPRMAGPRPNMSQGASECKGHNQVAGAELCTTSMAIDQQNLNPTSINIAGEFFQDGSEDSDMGYGADLNPEYDNPSSLATLAGSWERFPPLADLGNGSDSEINVLADGTFSGDDDGDFSDCEYTGTFSILDPDKNIYRMTMAVIECGDFNGSNYTGLAWIDVDPLTDTGTYLFFHVDNGDFVISDQLQPVIVAP